MSQEMLAGAAGVSARTVIRAEQGHEISAENLRAICAVLHLDVTRLRKREPPRDEPLPAMAEDDSATPIAKPRFGLPAFMAHRRALGIGLGLATLLGALNVASGYIVARTDTSPLNRSVSLTYARILAGNVNTMLVSIAKGEAPSAADLGASREYQRLSCEPSGPTTWLIGRGVGCRSETMRVYQRRADQDGAAFVVGPADDSVFQALALQLRQEAGTALRMSLSADAGPQRAGAFWFDPRGVDPRLLPRVSAERAYVHVEISRERAAR